MVFLMGTLSGTFLCASMNSLFGGNCCGLTFSEAIHFIPDIHYRDDSLWITRDIAFNFDTL